MHNGVEVYLRMDVDLVHFNDVDLTLSGRQLMKGVNFSMKPGEHVGVIGPSGAGKSTFIHLLLGLLQPSSGVVKLFNQDLSIISRDKLEDLRMGMGMLFQTNALFLEWSVYENIAFPIRYHYGLDESVIRNMVMLKLDSVGLRGTESLMPNELSGGMARRVALARAVALDPKFLVYDEPFTGQDPVTKSNLKILMKKIHRQYEVSSVIISHDIRDLSEIVDRMIVIWDGEVVAAGDVDDIMQSDNAQVKDFISGYSPLEQTGSAEGLLDNLLEGYDA